jgi:hypothetical protein
MFNGIQSALLIVLTISVSVALLYLLQRVWPYELRRQHNDLIGLHLSTIG